MYVVYLKYINAYYEREGVATSDIKKAKWYRTIPQAEKYAQRCGKWLQPEIMMVGEVRSTDEQLINSIDES